jgi:hypothetical protein
VKVLRRLASVVLKLVATGAFSVLLAACYGVIQVMYGVPARSGTIRVKGRASGLPLPGIKVSFRSHDPADALQASPWDPWPDYSDAAGEVDFVTGLVSDSLDAKLEDVDGAANGGLFAAATIDVVDELEVVELELEAIQPSK